MYTTILVICSIIIFCQYFYILRLRKVINYAISILKKYETAFKMDDIIREVNENGSKKDQTIDT